MKTILFLILFYFSFSTGCTYITEIFNPEVHDITHEDVSHIYSLREIRHHHIILTRSQSEEINRIYGQETAREGEEITFFTAERSKPTRIKRYIFLTKIDGNLGQIGILVGTFQGMVDIVDLKMNPLVDGKPVIPREFLKQFSGRTLQNSWEVVNDPSDFFTLPSKKRPIEGYPEESQKISDGIRKVLVFAEVLNLK